MGFSTPARRNLPGPANPASRIFRFGPFELDAQSGELRKQGLKIRLADQPFQTLVLLLERSGDVVTREEFRRKLWSADTFVDFDTGLNSAIKKLRDALGESAETPRFIETLPRRGYRFIAPMETPGVLPHGNVTVDVLPVPRRWVRPSSAWTGAVALTVVVVVLAALNVGGSWERLFHPFGVGAASTQINSIAVLPFENLTGDANEEYFVDGMTEALTTKLGQLKALRVISRTSAMQYKRAGKRLPQIALELNVDAVVEGGVARSGERVRVTAQLIHGRTDRHLWAQTYERDLRNVLVLQAEVAGAIADAVRAEVRPEERRRLTKAQAVSPDAYDEYLKGRFYWSSRSQENLLKAAEHFEKAIGTDPTYAPAYSGLSDTYRLFDLQGLAAPREGMPKAEAAARRALALDDTLAEAHASLAGVLYRYHWNWDEAEKEFRRSLELDPNYAEGHRAYGIYLLVMRRPDEALPVMQRAWQLSPLSPIINVELGTALERAGRDNEPIEQLRKTLEIEPNFPRVTQALALTYLRKGDLPEALGVVERAAARQARPTGPWLAYIYAISGRRPEALKILAALEERSQRQYVSPQHFAVVHLGLGQRERALALLETAYEQRGFEMLGFSGPLFDALHDEPRFRDLLRRMGLAAQKGYLSDRRQ